MNALIPTALRIPASEPLTADALIALARDCGADDAGVAQMNDPALDEERPHILHAFPAARSLLSLVGRMHREPVRSPARSIANLEFHHAGDALDDTARRIVRALEDRSIPALNPAMAFPMEMDDFPQRGWVVSHKRVAEAAGMRKMGVHRNLIHPKYGSFVLLGTVVIGAEVDAATPPLDFNPCMSCKLCVAACPVGAIKPDGYFDFSSCFNHNYQQFMGGFVNFIEDVASSRSVADFRSKQSYADTVARWQSLAYGPNYNAAHCLAVCPAGEDVIGPYLRDKIQHRKDVLDPLLARSEPVYVVKGGDADGHVRARFPHKRLRYVRSAARATSVNGFLFGMRLAFQPGKAKDLDAVYHFDFTGREAAKATITIRGRKLSVEEGFVGTPDLAVGVDGQSWLRFLAKEIGLARLLMTRRLKLKGSPSLLSAFGKCFPG